MSDIEIEIKVKVESTLLLIKFLDQNAKFVGESHQSDEYFTPSHRDFTSVRPAKEWLRLRTSPKGSSVNYKNFHHDDQGATLYCDEYESQVTELENLKKIFTALDIRPLVTVTKVRKIWLYENYEISLDSVESLGDFIEIEYKGDTSSVDPKVIHADMIAFLKSHECGRIHRESKGYPFMLLYPSEVTYTEV